MSATPLLEADSVVRRFDTRLVLKAGSVRCEGGIVTAVLGRNGAGKSTLLEIMCGLQQPDGGAVRLNGVAYEKVTLPWLARRGVFFLPDRDLLHPSLTVRSQLVDASRRRTTPSQLSDIITLLGIEHVVRQRPNQLSGGERRRAEVAFALARAPEVLVADEPFRGITPIDVETILRAFRHLAGTKRSVVFTGHEVTLLLSSVDRVYWVAAGTTQLFDSVPDALTNERFRREFLGVP